MTDQAVRCTLSLGFSSRILWDVEVMNTADSGGVGRVHFANQNLFSLFCPWVFFLVHQGHLPWWLSCLISEAGPIQNLLVFSTPTDLTQDWASSTVTELPITRIEFMWTSRLTHSMPHWNHCVWTFWRWKSPLSGQLWGKLFPSSSLP